jgi:hypothetical protein
MRSALAAPPDPRVRREASECCGICCVCWCDVQAYASYAIVFFVEPERSLRDRNHFALAAAEDLNGRLRLGFSLRLRLLLRRLLGLAVS